MSNSYHHFRTNVDLSMDIRSLIVVTSPHHYHAIFNYYHITYPEKMATLSITSNSWDFDILPFDLPKKVKLATTHSSLPIPLKWDVLETPVQ